MSHVQALEADYEADTKCTTLTLNTFSNTWADCRPSVHVHFLVTRMMVMPMAAIMMIIMMPIMTIIMTKTMRMMLSSPGSNSHGDVQPA